MDEVFAEFNRRLSDIGQVVIAGGAVRDWLMKREPKDYDVFVLGAPNLSEPFERALVGLEPVTMLDFHKSEPFLQGTFRFGGRIVQVMASPHTSVDALLDSFDWNVCRFAYDGSTVTDFGPIESIKAGETLKLHRVTFPLSTLRRGFRYSERFSMRLEYADIRRLCEAIAPKENPPTCSTCRHHEVDSIGDHWCALGISTAGRVRGLVTHLQPFGCSKHEGKEASDDE